MANPTMQCVACGSENPDRMKFCPECGASLRPTVEATREDEAERRQLTVLFSDLAESTALADRLDVEDLREVVHQYQVLCGDIVQRLGGTVAQYLGDGLLVYFGYPEAHEDDPRRAARSALDITDGITQLNERIEAQHGLRIAVRIGIHTGLVVAGEVGAGPKREQLALGQTPNIAARLQALADPNTVVVSSSVLRLIEDFFSCEPLGPQQLKGISQPIEVYRLLGERAAPSRFESAGRSTLVGRNEEMTTLLQCFAQAKAAKGQVALITGGAGIGKSLLVRVLKERTATEGCTWLIARCSSYSENSAFHPLIELLQRAFRIEPADPPEEKLKRLEEQLTSYGLPTEDAVPLFADFLSIPLGPTYHPPAMTPQRMKEKTVEALLGILRTLAAEQPLVFAMEDLHWADPSTLEFVDKLVEQTPGTRILALFTCRPAFAPEWGDQSHATAITLEQLTDEQVRGVVEGITKGKTLPMEVLEHVMQKTDGVPLFVEELTKMILETGLLREHEDRFELAGPLPVHAIPTTLQDSLMARLDGLAAGKEVAQLAAVIGREFSFELLHAVSTADEDVLRKAVDQLVGVQLLVRRGTSPTTAFAFRHALIQDAAYESLLKVRRQQHHDTVAQVLETRFPDVRRTQPEVLAYHYTEAGKEEPAIDSWIEAGRLALSRGTNQVAVRHLEKGLEVIDSLPSTPEQQGRELLLQTTLGAARTPIYGYAAPEVERAYRRAGELAEHLRDTPHLFWVVWGIWTFHIVRGNMDQALELMPRMGRLARLQPDSVEPREAHSALLLTHYFRGDPTSARESYEAGLAEAFPDGVPDFTAGLPTPPSEHIAGRHHEMVSLFGCASLALWHLGYPEQALASSRNSITIARLTTNPHSLGWALAFAARLHESLGDVEGSRRIAREVIALSQEHGLFWSTLGNFFLGKSLIVTHRPEDGDDALDEAWQTMRLGLDSYRAAGAGLSQTYMLAQIAELELGRGAIDEAQALLAEARAALERTAERYWEAELHRVGGEIVRSRGDKDGAESAFRTALDIARVQNCKALELRAAMSLGRLWHEDGQQDEARVLLADVYAWFQEGHETGDLRRAKALLNQW